LVNSGKNSFIYYYPHYRNSVRIMDSDVNSINIQLQDTSGNIIDLEGVSWSCVIRVDFRKTQDSINKLNKLRIN